MARARKSHDSDEEKGKTKLEPAYGACGDNRYVVYCDFQREGDEHARVLILNFKAKYAARFFLTKLIHNDEWEWVDPIGSRIAIRTTTGVRISMFGEDDLKMLLAYEPTAAEAEWRDEQVEKSVLRFKYGTAEGAKKDEPVADEDADLPKHAPAARAARAEKKEKVVKESKPKVDTSGMVSANDIAKELKVEGREVRGVLRALKLTKPDHGWAWPKAEAADIKKQIIAGLEAAKKGKKK